LAFYAIDKFEHILVKSYAAHTSEVNMLNHHDKITIRMIEQQMKTLDKNKTSDADILKILSDFVPDVKYILSAGGIKETKLCLKQNPYFSYFVSLVQGRKPRAVKL
jgi:hypothetical protein